MSLSANSSRSSSSESLIDYDPDINPLYPPKQKEKEEPKDWIKIGSIVAAVVGGLIILLGFACFQGIFPIELLGGKLGAGITIIVGATILTPAAVILFHKWQGI